MSIFMIMLFSFLIAILIFAIFALTVCIVEDERLYIAGAIVSFILFVASIFIGINTNTNNEKVYIEQYKAKKATIEYSLSSDALSGLERIELVSKAVDINGEMAARKAKSKLWHYVYTDDHIYDDVEPIVFD